MSLRKDVFRLVECAVGSTQVLTMSDKPTPVSVVREATDAILAAIETERPAIEAAERERLSKLAERKIASLSRNPAANARLIRDLKAARNWIRSQS